MEEESQTKNKSMKKSLIIAVVIVLLGVGTGYILSKNKSSGSSSSITTSTSATGKKVVGSADTSTFKDMAEGTLQEGGLSNGEGTHKLVRPGGESQTVYLTSSILDLKPFVGKKVKVWGQTHAAQAAGWLMDVGRVEVQ
jgi:hypothetical protein